MEIRLVLSLLVYQGNVNYSFDPRLLGIRKVWNGPFVRIIGMMDGRGKNSDYGKNSQDVE